MAKTSSLTALLAAAVTLASSIAACGPAAPLTNVPPAAPTATTGAPLGSVAPTASSPAPAASAPPNASGSHAPPGAMKPPTATAMAADLQALGLDPSKLPPLSKLEGDKLRKVMKLFTRALGAKCSACHTDDFAAPTPKKNVAEKMWDEFTRGLSMDDGQPLFCDSCHHGNMEFLDRHDMKALGKWMDDFYVGKTKRRDAKEHECATCHGDPFEGEFLKEWARAPAPKSKARP